MMKKSMIFILIIIIAVLSVSCIEIGKKPGEIGPSVGGSTQEKIADSDNKSKENATTSLAQTLGINYKNYPKIDGSTSTLSIARAINLAIFQSQSNENYPDTASKTVPSYKLLINGDIDMILVPYASSDVLAEAEDRGIELEFHPIAAEALVFITPIENETENISKEEVRNIYLKNGIKNWKELNGPDKELIPICRNADSGSQSQIDNLILNGERMNFSINKNHIELTMEGMLEQVAFYHSGGLNGKPTNSYALGYTLYTYFKSQGYMTGIDESLKLLAFEGIAPSEESIENGSYPLADAYYAVIRKDLPKENKARSLIEWLQGEDGKDLIRGLNLIPKS